jgi:hypothetical protein
MDYRVRAIDTELAATARRTLASPHYGHPATVETARGYGPCRSCLTTFRQNEEERLLFTFDPFRDRGTLASPGPVFIHREECRPPGSDEFPRGLVGLPIVLEGYDEHGMPRVRRALSWPDPQPDIDAVLVDPRIAFAHLRNAEAGCYLARVERAVDRRPRGV